MFKKTGRTEMECSTLMGCVYCINVQVEREGNHLVRLIKVEADTKSIYGRTLSWLAEGWRWSVAGWQKGSEVGRLGRGEEGEVGHGEVGDEVEIGVLVVFASSLARTLFLIEIAVVYSTTASLRR